MLLKNRGQTGYGGWNRCWGLHALEEGKGRQENWRVGLSFDVSFTMSCVFEGLFVSFLSFWILTILDRVELKLLYVLHMVSVSKTLERL